MSAIPLPGSTLLSQLQSIADSLSHLSLDKDEAPVVLGTLEQIRAAIWLKMASTAPAQAQHDELLPVEVAAERLGYKKDFLYRNSKKFPFTCREGRSVRFSARGIDEYIRAKCNKDILTARQQKRKLGLVWKGRLSEYG